MIYNMYMERNFGSLQDALKIDQSLASLSGKEKAQIFSQGGHVIAKAGGGFKVVPDNKATPEDIEAATYHIDRKGSKRNQGNQSAALRRDGLRAPGVG